ncbi:MAG: PilC/PilY family type IV pilus protein [Desulfobacteraceae bacterium]|nr:PilC/PilY family type IV pilus protein [Desulfobacteraceae bacterium]
MDVIARTWCGCDNIIFRSRYLAGVLILLFGLIRNAQGACIVDISDVPMETKAQSAPSNIMFVLDNSGSMDWEFMTTEGDGLYKGKYYLYPDSAYINGNDRVYGIGYELDSTKRREWQSQWSGYNKIFYNPNAHYAPWPNKTDASIDEPWSNPNNTTATSSKFNMDGEYFNIPKHAAVDFVVDNNNANNAAGNVFFLNTPAAWNLTSGNGYPYYLTDYYHTTATNDAVNDWVRWTPTIPSAGKYKVAVWWTSNTSRDTTVYYKVNHNGVTDTLGPYNMQNTAGQWNDLGEFYFLANNSQYIQLDPDIPGMSTYSADAVRFYTETISIKNAHYFMINDLNGNGLKDAGEDIYLVNFVDTNSDGHLDDRAYYRFDDNDSDGYIDDSGELFFVSEGSVPNGVKAGKYDEDGNLVGYATDAEDLQNFANWFSFYRKRELTAKAAVAGAIDDLSWVYVGFYSINTGLRQPVLPIQVETDSIIIDNKDSRYQETGSWGESGASNEYESSSRYTSNSGSYATWTPDIPATENYKVYVWYTYVSTRDTNAKYTVHHSSGDSIFRLNQKVNYSQWVELGEFNFTAGTSGYVRVTRDGSSTQSSTSADAVKFVSTSGAGIEIDETNNLLSMLYAMDSSGNTPLRLALDNVGKYFDMDDGDTGGLGSSPYAAAADGGGCQQSFAVVMTDGYWNGSDPSVGNQDADTASPFDGSPYADAYSNTLADVAMKYYKNDIADSLDNIVPTNSCDPANHQHMVTYTVSFGVTGTLTPGNYHSCLLDGSTPAWPNPWAGDRQKIDDLYHAAINGRGLFFSASDPQELVTALVDVTSNIASRMSSGASVSVNGDELNTGTVLYQASYVSGSWIGDVTAYPIDAVTGEIKKDETDILWHASDKLQLIDWTDRNIVSYDPVADSGIAFDYASLNAAQKILLNSDANVVDYIKGKEIAGFRSRTKKLGDIVHSAPLLLGDTIYSGGNDGMLHAFNALTGEERFAYVPSLILDNFHNDSDPTRSFYKSAYEHLFFVDLTPFARKNVDVDGEAGGNITLLVGGLGKGGKGYYGLDITNADTKTYNSDLDDIKAMVKWEYPVAADDDMGYSYSMPIIVKSNATAVEDVTKKKWVVIFGNGYGSTNDKSVLYILNADGTLLRKIDTEAAGCNGLSTPSVVDVNFDLIADYVYAGDLKGNLWKFDIRDADPTNWEVAFKDTDGNPAPLFSVPGKPITSKPDVMQHCNSGYENNTLICAGHKETKGYMVFFGTGKYLEEDDRTSTDSQYVFGIWDFGDDVDDSEYLGAFTEGGTPQLSNLGQDVQLIEQTEIFGAYVLGDFLRVLSDNTPDWTVACDATVGQDPDPDPTIYPPKTTAANAGWYFKLPIAGERIIKDVIVRDRKLIYLTFTPDTSPCSGGGNSIIHEVDACSGGRLISAQFDISKDRLIDSKDLIDIGLVDGSGNPILVAPSGIRKSGMLHSPVFVRFPDQPVEMKIFSSSAGTTETVFETNEPKGMFYWRNN